MSALPLSGYGVKLFFFFLTAYGPKWIGGRGSFDEMFNDDSIPCHVDEHDSLHYIFSLFLTSSIVIK